MKAFTVRPATAALTIAVVALLSVLFAVHALKVDGDVARAVKGTSPTYAAHQVLERDFGAPSKDEVFLVRSDDFGDPGTYAALENLVIDLQLSVGVNAVLSIFSLPDPAGGAASYLARTDIAGLPAAERLDRLVEVSPFAPYLISRDRTAAMLIVMPDLSAADTERLTSINAALDFADPALSVKPVSLAALQREISAALIKDQLFITPVSIILCVIVALLLFRSWRPALICALPGIAGLSWTFGMMAALGFAMDPLMAIIPTVVIVLGIADSVHVMHNILHLARSMPLQQAVLQGMRETMPAVILAAVTTAMAFLSLLIAGSPTVQNAAIIGPVGLTLVTLAVYLILPPAIMLNYRHGGPEGTRPIRFAAVTEAAVNLLKYRRAVTFFAFAILTALLAAQSQTVTGYRLMDHVPRASDFRATLAETQSVLPGSDQSYVMLPAPDPGSGLSQADRALLDRAGTALYGAAGGVVPTRDTGGAGHALVTRFQGATGEGFALPVIGDLNATSRDILAAAEKTRTALKEAGIEEFRLTGYSLMSSVELPVVVGELRLAFYVAVGLVTLLAALLTRSVRIALLSLVPNLIPILGVEAWLALTGQPLTITGALAFTIAFGIAVDDTIHLMNRIRVARHPGSPLDRAVVETALRATAAPVITTTIILLAGFAVSMLSLLPSVSLFGQLTAAAMVVALAADLFLFPSLMLQE